MVVSTHPHGEAKPSISRPQQGGNGSKTARIGLSERIGGCCEREVLRSVPASVSVLSSGIDAC